MEKNDIQPWDEYCPAYRLLDMLGKKWMFFVLICIYEGYNSFSLISKRIPSINSKMLTERLDFLVEKEIITRNVSQTKPLKISYALTKK